MVILKNLQSSQSMEMDYQGPWKVLEQIAMSNSHCTLGACRNMWSQSGNPRVVEQGE